MAPKRGIGKKLGRGTFGNNPMKKVMVQNRWLPPPAPPEYGFGGG
jgi:hypothetical protein